MIDLNDNTYKIVSIEESTGNVTVEFGCDGKEQTIAGLPYQDVEALKVEISNYLANYKRGLAIEQATAPSAVTDLIGKQQTSYLDNPQATPQIVVIADAGSPVDKLVNGEVTTAPLTPGAPASDNPTKLQEPQAAPVDQGA